MVKYSEVMLLCEQLEKETSCLKADAVNFCSMAKSGNSEICKSLDSMAIDQLEHIQQLALLLTGLITGEDFQKANADESVFSAGELSSTLGDKTDKTSSNVTHGTSDLYTSGDFEETSKEGEKE